MFERYTEKARRLIFFARYHASELGQTTIEAEHLLLGLLREDKALAHTLGLPAGSMEAIQEQIRAAKPAVERLSTSVDMPLSKECHRALSHAAEEADLGKDRHIGTEHLLLGLLSEVNSLAAKLLHQRGINLRIARERLKRSVASTAPSAVSKRTWPRTIRIHDTLWHTDYILDIAEHLRQFHWESETWKPRDVLAHKVTGKLRFTTAQPFDTSSWDLRPAGWTKDQCRICEWELFQSADPDRGTAFTNNRDWVCSECYHRFLEFTRAPEDYT